MFPCPFLNLLHSQCQNFSYDIRDLSSCTSVPRKGSGEWEHPNCPPQQLLTTQPSLELLPWPSACLPACSHTWGSCASSTLKGAHILNLRAFLLSFFFFREPPQHQQAEGQCFSRRWLEKQTREAEAVNTWSLLHLLNTCFKQLSIVQRAAGGS